MDTVTSFKMYIYGRDGELHQVDLPLKVASPFANRVFDDVLSAVWQKQVKEPWYIIMLLDSHTQPTSPKRATKPIGATSLHGEPYDPDQSEHGLRITLHPQAAFQFVELQLMDFQQTLYRATYSIDDIFLHWAHHLLNLIAARMRIDERESPFYYAVLPSNQPVMRVSYDLMPEGLGQDSANGVFQLPPISQEQDTKPRIAFRPIAKNPMPTKSVRDIIPMRTQGNGDPQQVAVYMPQTMYTQFCDTLRLSKEREEGGFMLGDVYQRHDGDGWIVELTDFIMGADTISNSARLVFTGETWSKVNQLRDREFADKKLVGWFHTHLFPATDDFGLSELDQDLHAWYMTQAWQIALLLNFEDDGTRTLRCYQRGADNRLVETPYHIVEG